MLSRPGQLLLALLLALSLLAGTATARPGLPEPDFGRDGIATLPPPAGSDFTPMSLARQPDGALLVAGRYEPGPRATILRFTAAGAPDRSFGDDGTLSTGSGSWDRLTVDGDGFLVAGGRGASLVVARFKADGTSDTSFGSDGVRSIDLSGPASSAGHAGAVTVMSLAVLPDGRIRLAGTFFDCPSVTWDHCSNAVLAGLSPEGAMDPSFGDGSGFTILEAEGDSIAAVFRDDGGSYLLRDYNFAPEGGSLRLYRFGPDGHQVGSWLGGISVRYAPMAISDGAGTMRIDSQGRILVSAGYTLLRFGPDGSFDESFSGSDESQLNTRLAKYLSDGNLVITDFTFDQAGRILLTGGVPPSRDESNTWASSSFIARILPNGEVDRSFGSGGVSVLWPGMGTSLPRVNSSRILLDGETAIVSGARGTDSGFGLSLARVSLGEMTMPSCGGRVATYVGTDGKDRMRAGDGTIVLLGGDDVATGSFGATVCGGEGDDVIKASGEHNSIDGGAGNDRIFGGGDRDALRGGPGRDLILGGNSGDRIIGGSGDDLLRGQQRDDLLFGGPGRDLLLGGQGRDQLFGGPGRDRLDAGGTGPPYTDYWISRPGLTLRLTRLSETEGEAAAEIDMNCLGEDPYTYRFSMQPIEIKPDGTFRYRSGDRDQEYALMIEDIEGRLGRRGAVARVRAIDSLHFGPFNYTCWSGSQTFEPGFDLMADSWVEFKARRLVRQRQFARQ